VKHPSNAQLTQINITYLNANPSEVSNFMFQAAVPKHAKLQVRSPSLGFRVQSLPRTRALMGKTLSLGPYSRHLPRALWWS